MKVWKTGSESVKTLNTHNFSPSLAVRLSFYESIPLSSRVPVQSSSLSPISLCRQPMPSTRLPATRKPGWRLKNQAVISFPWSFAVDDSVISPSCDFSKPLKNQAVISPISLEPWFGESPEASPAISPSRDFSNLQSPIKPWLLQALAAFVVCFLSFSTDFFCIEFISSAEMRWRILQILLVSFAQLLVFC